MSLKINPTPIDKLNRNVDRVKTLRLAISTNTNKKYIAGLQIELTRRENELKELMEIVNSVLD